MRVDELARYVSHANRKVQPSGATHVRWMVMGIVVAIMAVTAMNRLNLSIAGKYIEEEFSFSTIAMGRVFSAFLWGYGLFQIPWGYVCDRIGPRRTLTWSILCFAVGSGAMVFAPRFAAATGLSALAVFRIVRFLTGVGEVRSFFQRNPRHCTASLHPGRHCANAIRLRSIATPDFLLFPRR